MGGTDGAHMPRELHLLLILYPHSSGWTGVTGPGEFGELWLKLTNRVPRFMCTLLLLGVSVQEISGIDGKQAASATCTKKSFYEATKVQAEEPEGDSEPLGHCWAKEEGLQNGQSYPRRGEEGACITTGSWDAPK